MDYAPIQREAVEGAAEIVRRELAPIASEIDRTEEFPLEAVRAMGRAGLLGVPYPVELGGAGLNYVTYSGIIREIARVCASTAMTVVAHTTLTGYPLYRFGSPEQKERFLIPLASGTSLGAYASTEPGAGSDLAGIQTTAVELDDHYVLNGSKLFITNANYADLFIIAATTAPGQGALGLSVFVVERETAGFRTSGKRERKLGMRGSDTGELIFEDALVPRGNLIGKKNFGLKILHDTLVTARIGMASIALGIAEIALDHCLDHVKERKQFGEPLAKFQTIRNMLADMELGISAARLLVHHAASLKDNGSDVTKAASEAKLFASEVATKVTKDAIQIFGGYGYLCDYPLERYFRDAKLTEIGDGTSEMQRLIIADELLRRPV
jgi:butyryl-CoA dehydrogenase/acyl-CoA dehydrogenase